MTFSDSRIVRALQTDWIPVWESVSPVKEVTFDLGEGREVTGTVGGEIALYFCDQNGNVFDILPALQSPAATLAAIKEATRFYQQQNGQLTAKTVRQYHLQKMRETLAEQRGKTTTTDLLYSTDQIIGGVNLAYDQDLTETTFAAKVDQIQAAALFPNTAIGTKARDTKITSGKDPATRDLREMAASKVRLSDAYGNQTTIVEPGGRGYYRWQVRRAFCGKIPRLTNKEIHLVPTSQSPSSWTTELKQPEHWKRVLFTNILHQPLKGGKFKYDSESLEAISIIEEAAPGLERSATF